MLFTRVLVSRRVHRNSIHPSPSSVATLLVPALYSALSTTPRYLHLGSHPRRNPSLSRSTDHFNLHYVRPRIAEGSIKFLLSRAAFSKAAKAYHQRTRHLSNGLSALSRVAPWPRIIYLPAANPRNCFSFLVTNHGKTCKQQDSSIDSRIVYQ